MDIIVSVDENWGIGNNGQLLTKISADLKRFRKMTTNNIIIMGRKTLESFPEGKPLPNRINIVMTHSQEYTCDGVKVCHNIQEVLKTIAKETKSIKWTTVSFFLPTLVGIVLCVLINIISKLFL